MDKKFLLHGYARAVSKPYRITIICLGNICRSPIGEAVVRDRLSSAGLGGQVTVDSAGTGDWHVGQNANVRALSALADAGYALDHAARQITQTWFSEIDLALVMDSANYADVSHLAELSGEECDLHMMRHFDPALSHLSEPDSELDVPDPYHGTDQDFQDVLRMIEQAADGLITSLLPRFRPSA